MRMVRLLLASLVAMIVAGPVWLRDPPYRHNPDQRVSVAALSAAPVGKRFGPFILRGAWQVSSSNSNFGGYSALLVPRAGWLRAYSDLGQRLDFPQPGQTGRARQAAIFGASAWQKADRDIESASLRPDGSVWLAAEGSNTLLHFTPAGKIKGVLHPAAMRGWSINSGAEAMAVLGDGRFIALSEAYAPETGRAGHVGLRFSADRPGRAERFLFKGQVGHRPTDMALLPDGRAIILMRQLRWPMPPRFGTWLVLADPGQIAAGKAWQSQPLTTLDGTGLEENYEGIAIEPQADGRLTVWLISDANGAVTQRTLLLRLELDPADLPDSQAKQKAPG